MKKFDEWLKEQNLNETPAAPPKPITKPKPPKPQEDDDDFDPKPVVVPGPKNKNKKFQDFVNDKTSAPTKPITKPKPPKPQEDDDFDPKPVVVPGPKNKREHTTPFNLIKPKEKKINSFYQFMEAYEDDVHPTTSRFWRNLGDHTFSTHPVLRQYGHEMSKKSWDDLQPGTEGSSHRQASNMMAKIQGYMMQAMQIEQRHKQQLEQLAKEVTAHIWGIPLNKLKANLTQQMGGAEHDQNTETDQDFNNRQTLTPELKDQVHKRITMNLLVHGSSMHTLKSAHHAPINERQVNQEIVQLIGADGQKLVELYNKITEIVGKQMWLINIPALFGNLGAGSLGSSKVDYEEDGAKVNAKAMLFPFLVHELMKGTAELMTHHGLQDMDEGDARKVLDKADDIRHEPYLSHAGPALWRKIIHTKIRPEGVSLAKLIKMFAKMQPRELHNIISKIWEANTDDEMRDVKERLEELAGVGVNQPEPEYHDDEDGEEDNNWGADWNPDDHDDEEGGVADSEEDWDWHDKEDEPEEDDNVEGLKRQLRQAIEDEDYRKAAELRDKIRRFNPS